MNITLKRINSQWYEISAEQHENGWIVRAISDGWVVVERNDDSSFGTLVGSGATMNEAIDNWMFPATKPQQNVDLTWNRICAGQYEALTGTDIIGITVWRPGISGGNVWTVKVNGERIGTSPTLAGAKSVAWHYANGLLDQDV